MDKNYPTVGQKLSNAVGQNLSNELVKNYPRNITDTTNNNTDRLQEQSIVLSERLEAIVNQFSNGDAARRSFKQLLDSGKTEEWIVAAINNKGISYFNKYGTLGLLFTNSYQKEIDNLLFKKKHDAAATEEWRKAMFEQGSQNLVKQPTVISVTKNKALSKPKNNRQRPPYDLDEIAKMA